MCRSPRFLLRSFFLHLVLYAGGNGGGGGRIRFQTGVETMATAKSAQYFYPKFEVVILSVLDNMIELGCSLDLHNLSTKENTADNPLTHS